MRVRYQADADLNEIILLAAVRREPTMDFQTATAAGLAGRHDLDVLALAAARRTRTGNARPPDHATPFCRICSLSIRRPACF